eukprot:29852-Prymnesium_polylepis.5
MSNVQTGIESTHAAGRCCYMLHTSTVQALPGRTSRSVCGLASADCTGTLDHRGAVYDRLSTPETWAGRVGHGFACVKYTANRTCNAWEPPRGRDDLILAHCAPPASSRALTASSTSLRAREPAAGRQGTA